MITLMELINATTWLRPQDRIKICLWDKSKIYEDGNPEEFKDIKLTVRTLAKYGNYYVSDIDIDCYDGIDCLNCLIWKD